MAIPITAEVARLLTSRGREKALTNAGIPDPIARLAGLFMPDPLTPYSFATLRALDLPARRAAALAQERLAMMLAEMHFADPSRIWSFLERHPRPVHVQTVPKLTPAPRGLQGAIFGETRIPSSIGEPIAVTVAQRAPDRGGVAAHELVHVATELAGRSGQPFPGLAPSYVGTVKFFQHYQPTAAPGEYLATLADQPGWLTLVDRAKVLQALDEWFPRLPDTSPIAAGLSLPPLVGR